MDSKDIHQKEFKRSMRGYNEDEVDVFLDEVAEAIDKMTLEQGELKARLIEHQERIRSYERMENAIQETLLNAQKTADEVTSKAKREAELLAKDAEMRARIVLSQAEDERDKIKKSLAGMLQIKDDFKSKYKSLMDIFLFKIDDAVRVEEETITALGASAQKAPEMETANTIESSEETEMVAENPSKEEEVLPNFLADGPRVDFLKDT